MVAANHTPQLVRRKTTIASTIKIPSLIPIPPIRTRWYCYQEALCMKDVHLLEAKSNCRAIKFPQVITKMHRRRYKRMLLKEPPHWVTNQQMPHSTAEWGTNQTSIGANLCLTGYFPGYKTHNVRYSDISFQGTTIPKITPIICELKISTHGDPLKWSRVQHFFFLKCSGTVLWCTTKWQWQP